MGAMDDDVEPPGIVGGLSYDERVEEFLRLLASGLGVRKASASVQINWSTLYKRRKEDAAFAKRWDDALRITIKQLEDEAFRRAMGGSDKLLMFLLERLNRQRFGQRQEVEHTGGVALHVITGIPDPEPEVGDLL